MNPPDLSKDAVGGLCPLQSRIQGRSPCASGLVSMTSIEEMEEVPRAEDGAGKEYEVLAEWEDVRKALNGEGPQAPWGSRNAV